jgi:hypothetical protein
MDIPESLEVKLLARKLEEIKNSQEGDRNAHLTRLALDVARIQHRIQSALCIGYIDFSGT